MYVAMFTAWSVWTAAVVALLAVSLQPSLSAPVQIHAGIRKGILQNRYGGNAQPAINDAMDQFGESQEMLREPLDENIGNMLDTSSDRYLFRTIVEDNVRKMRGQRPPADRALDFGFKRGESGSRLAAQTGAWRLASSAASPG